MKDNIGAAVEISRENLQEVDNTTAPLIQQPTPLLAVLQYEDIVSLRERLVEIVPEYPSLWCTNIRSYKDLAKKIAA
jgi:hypothetical protein